MHLPSTVGRDVDVIGTATEQVSDVPAEVEDAGRAGKDRPHVEHRRIVAGPRDFIEAEMKLQTGRVLVSPVGVSSKGLVAWPRLANGR